MPKILVVDDDARMVRLLSLTLPATFEVFQASKGEDAVMLAEKNLPDVILLDINMPGLNGFEVLQRVKQSKRLKKTRGIMGTARSDEADRPLGAQLGADAYFTKPFSPLSLLEKVSQLLGGK